MRRPEFEIKNGVLLYYNGNLKTEIIIPDGVTRIGDNTFQGLEHVTSVVIPSSVKRIGFGAFRHCSELKQVTLPDGLTSIENNTFEHCIRLESMVIPKGVTRIGNHAFYFCHGLTSLVIPKSVRKIGISAFEGCANLKYVSYHDVSFRDDDAGFIPLESIFKAIDEKRTAFNAWPPGLRFSLIWGMFFDRPDDEEVFKAVRGNFVRMFRYLIDENDTETARKVIESGKFIKKGNIDKLIQYAIEKQAIEIQILLTDYKAEHIGYASTEEVTGKKFKL